MRKAPPPGETDIAECASPGGRKPPVDSERAAGLRECCGGEPCIRADEALPRLERCRTGDIELGRAAQSEAASANITGRGNRREAGYTDGAAIIYAAEIARSGTIRLERAECAEA